MQREFRVVGVSLESPETVLLPVSASSVAASPGGGNIYMKSACIVVSRLTWPVYNYPSIMAVQPAQHTPAQPNLHVAFCDDNEANIHLGEACISGSLMTMRTQLEAYKAHQRLLKRSK